MNPPIDPQHLPLWPQHPDTHYSHLAGTLPPWLLQASSARRAAVAAIAPDMIGRFKHASPHQHRILKHLNSTYWSAQNSVDQYLGRLQDAQSFGEPLLRDALKQRYGLDLDVRATWLRLYISASIPWFPIKSGAARTWTVSLLDAALHNFEPAEAEEAAYEADSTFITQPSATGQFEVLDTLKHRLGISDFARLCRELDIGAKYQAWLDDNLGVSNPVVNAALSSQIKASDQAALRMALELAVIDKEPIGHDTYRSIRGLVDGVPGMLLAGKPLLCHELTMMSASLTGILLFAPDLERNRSTVPVIAYIPDDPQQPLKEYASGAHFMADLSRKLRETEYQQFFSRFVAHADRGYFFADLNNRLTQITWHQRPYGDPLPSWRATGAAHANLQFAATPITGDVWTRLHQRKLDKILNDARTIAVSTASANRNARWERWDSLTGIASTLLQIAAFVALPFVPFLGELMLAYAAYQVLDETFESIVDWAQGLTQQALAHTMGVVESLVQLGTFAAGGNIAVGEFRQLLPREWVDFIDRFTPVKNTDGRMRYWNGDLKPYEHSATLPDSEPDALGLRRHGDTVILALEGKRYSVKGTEHEPYRIEHPSRPDAYAPQLKHNGHGSWQTELDQPLAWNREKLMRRLGRIADTLSVSDREKALSVSGYHENAVRKLHVDLEPLPSLLADTLTRFKIDRELGTFIERMGSDDPAAYLTADAPTQLQLLTEYLAWPEHKALRLIDSRGEVAWHGGSLGEAAPTTYDIRPGSGDALKAALNCLDDAEIKTLAEERFGAPALSMDARAAQLRKKIAEIAQRQRSSLFDARYRAQQRNIDPLGHVLVDAVPGLPGGAAEELLLSASGTELQQLEQGTVAPRLRELARWTQQNVRAVRAREGLELASIDNPDTERLALHLLPRLPGWSGEVRIDVARYSYAGDVIDQTGLPTAPTRKVLVQLEDGRYQAYDDVGLQLSGAEDFYDCVLKALPDSERLGIKYNIGQALALKEAIARQSVPHDEVQRLLASQPLLKPAYDPHLMRLPGGGDGFGYAHRHPGAPSLHSRVRELYPSLSADEVSGVVRTLQEHPAGARIELSRLFAEFGQLDADLRTWTYTEVHHNPLTGAALTPAQLNAAAQNRVILAAELRRCWRRQTAISDPAAQGGDPDYLFQFTRPLIGEFPRLNADFSHITYVILEGNETTFGAGGFLNTFTGMRRLAVRNIALQTLPDVVASRPNLTQLILSNCRLSLTEQSQAVIASLHQMRTLDLYRNPLGMGLSLEAMPDLEYLDLSGCSLSSTPPGLATRTKLTTAILTDNVIGYLPVELFDLPPSRINHFEFDNNPLSDATRNRIKASYQRSRQDFGVTAPQADLERAVNLYPLLDREEASAFVYRLPGTLEVGRAELTRLETEYTTMVETLANWTADVPAVNPVSGEPFTPGELLIEHSTRDDFKREMEKAWRREIELDGFDDQLDPSEASYELVLDMPVTGDLPALNADFGHVSHLYISSETGLTRPNSNFLRCFPRLKALTIRSCRLSNVPDAVLNMGQLKSLVLTNCQVTLTPGAVAGLAGMEQMDILDLSENPLVLAPDVSQMTDLSTLILDRTQIIKLPDGLLQLRALDDVNLSSNGIQQLPGDLLELPMEIAESINLRNNPFSEQSLQLLHAYFRKTGVDFGVESIIDEAEMEVSDSDDSTQEE